MDYFISSEDFSQVEVKNVCLTNIDTFVRKIIPSIQYGKQSSVYCC